MYIFPIMKPILLILFFCAFEFIRAWFLWLITCAILGFFMNLTFIVIIEGKMLYYASFCFFELLCSLRCSCALYCSSALTLLTVSSIMTLFSIIYTSSIFELLLLLQNSLKCLLLLEFIVWPLLLWLLSIGTLTFRFLKPIIAIYMLKFLYTTKIHWFWTFILLSCCLLWYFFHWDLPNVSFIGLFSLVDPVVNLNYFVNQLLHILGVFHKY